MGSSCTHDRVCGARPDKRRGHPGIVPAILFTCHFSFVVQLGADDEDGWWKFGAHDHSRGWDGGSDAPPNAWWIGDCLAIDFSNGKLVYLS